MKAEVIISCTGYDLIIDGKSAKEYSDQELYAVYQKMISPNAEDKDVLISLIDSFVRDSGELTVMENCEQCGDNSYKYKLEINKS